MQNSTVLAQPFPLSLDITPASRWPTRLPEATLATVLSRPLPVIPIPATEVAQGSPARVSIIIVTYNNLVYTRLCLESLLAHTDDRDYEIIVVDNGSADGTVAYLREMDRIYGHLCVHFNQENAGFAVANNQGLAKTRGDVLVLLNNDTLVPPGWLSLLVGHLQDPTVGLVGPVTNRCGNEAQIEVPYRTYGEFLQFARDYQEAQTGKRFDIPMLMMFCVAMRRETYSRIGALDERFEIGMFEDDDYAMRIRAAGQRIVCAEDVFVHHFGQASIGKLADTGAYGKLFQANRQRFETKWGISWQRHQQRPNPAYEQLAMRIRAVAEAYLPPDATVIVASKGDESLLELPGRRAWHFPQAEDGVYAGYYPADSAAAIWHLEALRAKGAQFLILPSTAFWWLEHYTEFKDHLERQFRVVLHQEDTCMIVAL